MRSKQFVLACPHGLYEADSLLELLWDVFKHRLEHFLNGDGWMD